MKGIPLMFILMTFLLESSIGFLIQKKQSPRLSEAQWNTYSDRDVNGPGTYSFGYDIDDAESGNTQFRQEERFPNGTVEGSYGLTEPDGNVRIVEYTADHLGYRATIKNSIRKNEDYPPRTVHQSHMPSWILQKQNTATGSQQYPKVSPPVFLSNAIEQPSGLVPLLSYYKGKFYPLYVNGPISRWIIPNNYYPRQDLHSNSL